jgi:hypothetical protein
MASKDESKKSESAVSTDPGEYLADVPTQLASGVLGLMGFMTACVVGLVAGNPGIVIISRALVAMLICSFVGKLLGAAGEMCVREFVMRYKSDRPVPQKPLELVNLDRQQMAHNEVIDTMKKAA